MRTHFILSFVLLIFLAGCSDNSAQNDATTTLRDDLPKLVNNSELSAYWIIQNNKLFFESSSSPRPNQNGEVEVGFIIDANGQTSQYEVLKSSPAGLWEPQAINGAKQLRFKKATTNTYDGSIYTTWLFAFKAHRPE